MRKAVTFLFAILAHIALAAGAAVLAKEPIAEALLADALDAESVAIERISASADLTLHIEGLELIARGRRLSIRRLTVVSPDLAQIRGEKSAELKVDGVILHTHVDPTQEQATGVAGDVVLLLPDIALPHMELSDGEGKVRWLGRDYVIKLSRLKFEPDAGGRTGSYEGTVAVSDLLDLDVSGKISSKEVSVSVPATRIETGVFAGAFGFAGIEGGKGIVGIELTHNAKSTALELKAVLQALKLPFGPDGVLVETLKVQLTSPDPTQAILAEGNVVIAGYPPVDFSGAFRPDAKLQAASYALELKSRDLIDLSLTGAISHNAFTADIPGTKVNVGKLAGLIGQKGFEGGDGILALRIDHKEGRTALEGEMRIQALRLPLGPDGVKIKAALVNFTTPDPTQAILAEGSVVVAGYPRVDFSGAFRPDASLQAGSYAVELKSRDLIDLSMKGEASRTRFSADIPETKINLGKLAGLLGRKGIEGGQGTLALRIDHKDGRTALEGEATIQALTLPFSSDGLKVKAARIKFTTADPLKGAQASGSVVIAGFPRIDFKGDLAPDKIDVRYNLPVSVRSGRGISAGVSIRPGRF